MGMGRRASKWLALVVVVAGTLALTGGSRLSKAALGATPQGSDVPLSSEKLSMGTHTRIKVGAVVGYGVLSGIWIYAAKRGDPLSVPRR